MDTTNLLLFTVGIIVGSGLSFAALSSRAYDKRFKNEIDAERAMEIELQRRSPPVESTAPMRPTPVMR